MKKLGLMMEEDVRQDVFHKYSNASGGIDLTEFVRSLCTDTTTDMLWWHRSQDEQSKRQLRSSLSGATV